MNVRGPSKSLRLNVGGQISSQSMCICWLVVGRKSHLHRYLQTNNRRHKTRSHGNDFAPWCAFSSLPQLWPTAESRLIKGHNLKLNKLVLRQNLSAPASEGHGIVLGRIGSPGRYILRTDRAAAHTRRALRQCAFCVQLTRPLCMLSDCQRKHVCPKMQALSVQLAGKRVLLNFGQLAIEHRRSTWCKCHRQRQHKL